jgi:hypothetical protein
VTLTTISGTADASIADLSGVEVKISTNGTGQLYYWTGSTWTTNITWLSTTKDSNTAWHYDVPVAMIGNSSYSFVARALDYASNYSTIYSTRFATIDISSPAVAITYPVDTVKYSPIQTSTPIAGTSSDPGGFAVGISTVQISLVDLDGGGNDYYDGSIFTSGGPFYLGITGGTLANWTFTNSALSFTNDHRYTATARSTDRVGNYTNSTAVQFSYDNEIPTSTINSPSPGPTRSSWGVGLLILARQS